jgi:hypothetical protein
MFSMENFRLSSFDQNVLVEARVDGSQTAGLIHVRQALLADGSYDWQADRSDCVPSWDYGLRFGPPADRVTVFISLNCSRLTVLESGKSVSVEPISKGLKKFLEEQFAGTE